MTSNIGLIVKEYNMHIESKSNKFKLLEKLVIQYTHYSNSLSTNLHNLHQFVDMNLVLVST